MATETLPLVTDPQGNPIATSAAPPKKLNQPVADAVNREVSATPTGSNPYVDARTGEPLAGMGVPADNGDKGTSHNPWGASPNGYNVNANLASSEGLAQNVYGQAYQGLQNMGQAPSADIRSLAIAAPDAIHAQNVNAPSAIQAQQVQASGLVQGQQAEALRSQQLGQAAAAANSPSAATAP